MPTPADWNEVEDDLSDTIADSIDMDWNSRDGAKAVVRWLNENSPRDAAAELLEALRPFAEVLADVGGDEDDEDLYRAMTKAHRRAPAITVGHLRAARAAIAKAALRD